MMFELCIVGKGGKGMSEKEKTPEDDRELSEMLRKANRDSWIALIVAISALIPNLIMDAIIFFK